MWKIPKDWINKPAILLGGGASLRGFPFEKLEGHCVIGCNSAYKLGPKVVSYCLFNDTAWWQRSRIELEQFIAQGGTVVCNSPALAHLKIQGMHCTTREKHGVHEKGLGFNYSTGATAICLAVALGSTDIYLLGYDLQAVQTQTHWHKFYTKRTQPAAFKRFMRGFDTVFRDLRDKYPEVTVRNVVGPTGSALNHFPHVTMSQFKQEVLGT